ncbi:outer membrane protein [Vibrio cholerae]|uniref:outer membrane protein n=1 Tax=Vibrio cholerae TaxID=666 RepID=UPI00021AA99D|nr:outer membrane beta-barrel protein [Vibrio cholerae]EGQ8474603.1 outer membrane beta-barrel protein [Vibrio cholerae]EGS69649.1 hypothetical protein VCBJG01_1380 [Vibrio cholerae BJG-01]EHD2280996.1 outer membrane beta-barrel protein [Vibrio cholerae]EJL6365391.1 outer membrane beta-barrel protein [Vibrio cholerae]EJL6471289.1 outer membrane beta-barrel protein [Vibrio cholerae]
MKTVISLLATSILFASSVQAETTQETMSNNQFGISFKSSDFGNDFNKDTSSDLKDIDEKFAMLGIHWGATKQLNEQQLTTRYVFLDYGNTEITLFDAYNKLVVERQLAILGVGQNIQHNFNDLFYVKAGAEIGLYHDELDVSVRSLSRADKNQSNTGALLAASVGAGIMFTEHWNLELGYKCQYLASNKFDGLDNVNFTKASQVFLGVNYNY